MQSDARVPLYVAFDAGQGEGAAFITYERARRGFRGLQGYRDGRLHLVCSFCESAFSVPHSEQDKQPFSMRFTDAGEHVECASCRAARGVEPLAAGDGR